MKRYFILSAVIVLAPLVLFLFITVEHSRVSSPDGRFVAVTSSPIYQFVIPMMPGGGSDKSGYITVYTADGRSCGRAPIEMLWMIQDLRWSPERAELSLVAEWDLANCRIHIERSDR